MRKAFTLIELLVVISIIALLIAILLPALSSARQSARKIQSSTQVRGLHQGFVIFAQSNKGLFPGLTMNGSVIVNAHQNDIDTINYGGNGAGRYTNVRIAIARLDDLFTSEYTISPAETNPLVVPWDPNGTYADPLGDHLTSYAFSMLPPNNLMAGSGWAAEWQETTNSRAIVLGDRATAMGNFADPATYASLWGTNVGNWNGSVLFNDNSVQFVFDREFEGTQYGTHTNTLPDNIFIGTNDQNVGVNGGNATNNCDLAPGNGFLNFLAG